jgi:hypothetical protein
MLGAYPDHSLADARHWATEQRQMLDNGVDPIDTKREASREKIERASMTCGALLDAYVAHLAAQGKQSHADVQGIFRRHVPGKVSRISAQSVTQHDLIPLIRGLRDCGKGRTAAKLRSYLRAAFELVLNADQDSSVPASMLGFKLTHNPAARIKVPVGVSTPGERALTRQELSEYVRHVDAVPDVEMRNLLQMQLLLAGQRVSQLLRATVERDSNGSPVVVIRDGKGRRTTPRWHVLPLQGKALAIVEARGGSLFGITDEKVLKQTLERASSLVGDIAAEMVKAEKAVSGFRLGDIRRTVETLLAGMGISKDLRAQLLSHGLSGVQHRHYDKFDYLPEKATILVAWEAFLAEPPADNVVSLKDKRARRAL